MRKTLLAAIIAATALVPPVALAQDRGGRWGNRNGGEARAPSGEVRQNRGEWRQRAQTPAPAPVQAQAAPAPVQQARPQRQWSGDRGQQAQQGPRREWNGERRQQQSIQPQAQLPQAQQRSWMGGNRLDRGQVANGQDRQRQQYRGDRNRDNRGWNDNNRNWNGGDRNRGWDNNRNNNSRWNNGWRNNNRYDWRGYRNSNRNAYRLPRYYAPSGYGYGYRRFGIGFTLSSILFSQNYWINDPYSYRLPEVYGPYRWVRYYNDALLVDIYTGEVVDTVYDIFW
jgi:nickel/cobalt transporter regulator